jgi:serine/threonine-protein kinase
MVILLHAAALRSGSRSGILVRGAMASRTLTGIPSAGEMLAGKYRVEKLLGTGGMGIVVAATHVHLQDEVAIKLLRRDHAVPGRSAQRLLREARAATKIRSEHVARVYDVGVLDDGSPFIVMERLRGSDLATVLASEPKRAVTSTIDWVLQACEAVVEAHVNGIVHRDLKPANLFRTHRMDGSVCIKVLDFGISKIARDAPRDGEQVAQPAPTGASAETTLDPGASDVRVPEDGNAEGAGLTITGARVGSPRYMAPEQVRAEGDVDHRADIWSLGAITYEMLTGRPPFDGETADALGAAILSAPTPPIRESDVTRGLERAVLKCLEKDKSARHADVGELATALAPFGSTAARASADRIARVLRGAQGVPEPEPSAPRADGFAVSQAEGASSVLRRSTIVIAGAIAVGLVALVVGAKATSTRETRSATNIVEAASPAPSPTIVAPPSAETSAIETTYASAPPPPRLPTAERRPRAPAASAASSAPAATSTPEPTFHLDAGTLFDGRR